MVSKQQDTGDDGTTANVEQPRRTGIGGKGKESKVKKPAVKKRTFKKPSAKKQQQRISAKGRLRISVEFG
jgi:hypothetical protein